MSLTYLVYFAVVFAFALSLFRLVCWFDPFRKQKYSKITPIFLSARKTTGISKSSTKKKTVDDRKGPVKPTRVLLWFFFFISFSNIFRAFWFLFACASWARTSACCILGPHARKLFSLAISLSSPRKAADTIWHIADRESDILER